MKNPVEEYIEEKTAGFGRSVSAGLERGIRGMSGPSTSMPGAYRVANMAGRVGSTAGTAAIAAAGAGVVAGGAVGMQKLYDAATKARDFRAMLEADPRLAEMHAEDPRRVNQMFSTLRTFNPAFTRDPIVASHYVLTMVEDPVHAGSKAVEALQSRDKLKNPLADRVTNTAFHRAEKQA